MLLEAVIERVWGCIWRPRSSKFGDALGGRDQVQLRDASGCCGRASLEIRLKAEIVELRDALGGRDEFELSDALGGYNQPSSEMHLEAEIV